MVFWRKDKNESDIAVGAGDNAAATAAAVKKGSKKDKKDKKSKQQGEDAAATGSGLSASSVPPATFTNIRKFAAETWLSDAVDALRLLLASPTNKRKAFEEYLKHEYSVNNLQFYDAVTVLIGSAVATPEGPLMVPFEKAKTVYDTFILAGSGQQVNLSSQRMFAASFVDDPSQRFVDATFLVRAQTEILKLMALDSYPRFLRSKYCQDMLSAIERSGKQTRRKSGAPSSPDAPNSARTLEELLESGREQLSLPAELGPALSGYVPTPVLNPGATRWLLQFATVADYLPCCIVISDMQTPGVPIAWANKAFCEATQYTREEIVGQNCRFLQGPKTDLGSVELMRRAIRNGRELHIQLLNYRKDGSTFRNFLSLKPVWDSEVDPAILARPPVDVSRIPKFPLPVQLEDIDCDELHPKMVKQHLLFVIGVQYVLPENRAIEPKVLQHQALLKLLPATVPRG